MNLKYENGCIIVMNNNDIIVTINVNDFSFGIGDASYKMSHGSFRFKEKGICSYPCKVQSSIESENGLALVLENDSQVVGKVNFKIKDNILSIEPDVCDECNRFSFSLLSSSDEAFYGSGEVFSEFNLKGQKVNVWVAEHINAAQIAKKVVKLLLGQKNPNKKQKFSKYETYYAQPTFLSSNKYFLHCDTTDFASFDFSSDKKTVVNINDAKSKVIIGFGCDFEKTLESLTSVLGRQSELPNWVYDGSILGIQGGTDVMINKINACLEKGAKINGVWIQDWEGRRVTAVGKQLMWNWKYDNTLYPNLPDTIRELGKKDIKVLGYINPFLAVEKDLYKYASSKGYCVHDKDGKDYLVKITTFPAAMVDLTNPDAYQWIKSVIKENMIGIGLAGWMADFGEYLPTDCVLYSGDDARSVHNTWPARWAQVNREALEETDNIGKIFFFTRSGYTGTVKNSTMMWTGDHHVDYSIDFGLPSVIPATLSLCCCGFGLTHSDIGGYTTFLNLKRTPELYMRWCEMNVFSPLMRSHEGLNPDANAQFDFSDTVMEHHQRMSKIHLALKPYIMSLVKFNAEYGVGVMRPLFFYYDGFKNECSEYLLGRDMLVAPVLCEGKTSRAVKLPNDNWVSLWSGKEYNAGEFMADAPLGYPPVFYRKNSSYAELFETIKNIK